MIKPNNDDKFDIDLSQLNNRIDTSAPFTDSEKPSLELIDKFISTRHELKNQMSALSTNNFYVEYGMEYTHKPKHISGILKSEAEFQTYTVGDMLFSFSTDFIKYLFDNRKKLKLDEKKKNDTNYIAHGFLIPIDRMMELYSNYRKDLILKSIKK